MGEQAGRKQNIFCLRDANSTSLKYVAWVRKRGNIGETLKVSVPSVIRKCFLVCAPTKHVLKTQNLRLESRKFFLKFSRNIFCVQGAILFLQQCFLIKIKKATVFDLMCETKKAPGDSWE